VAAAVRVLLRLTGRSRAGGLLATYRTVLGEPPHRRAVRALAVDDDPPARRFGVELALDLGEYVKGDLLRAALHDHDQVCRRLCAQRLLEIDPEQAGRLLRARAPGTGVGGGRAARRRTGHPAGRAARRPGPDGTAQARWQLYQRGEPPAEVYRKQLGRAIRTHAPARLLAGLAAGLGSAGTPATRLSSPGCSAIRTAVVRRAAARAIGRLAKPDELVGLLGPLATDPDQGVAREVFEGLSRVPDDVPAETLWIGRTRTEPAVRAIAERIGERTGSGARVSGLGRTVGRPVERTDGRAAGERVTRGRAQAAVGDLHLGDREAEALAGRQRPPRSPWRTVYNTLGEMVTIGSSPEVARRPVPVGRTAWHTGRDSGPALPMGTISPSGAYVARRSRCGAAGRRALRLHGLRGGGHLPRPVPGLLVNALSAARRPYAQRVAPPSARGR